MFRQTLETMRPARDPRKGGRSLHDVLRMFKVLALRELGSLSDEQVEYADVEHGFVRDYMVTPAATHDAQVLPALLDITRRGQPVSADSAYRSAATQRRCKDYGLTSRVLHKAQRNRPLSAAQKRTNHRWAKTRARVEHVFARIDLFRRGTLLRCTGLRRATVVIGLINFVHNLRRLATMHRQALAQASG